MPSQATASGVAAFANLSINNLGTGYTLSASAPGLGTAASNAFNIVVPSGLVYTDPAPGGNIRLVYDYGQSSANVARARPRSPRSRSPATRWASTCRSTPAGWSPTPAR